MIHRIINKARRLFNVDNKLEHLQQQQRSILREIEVSRILEGRRLAHQLKTLPVPERIRDVEFKVFSQYGDDGIIQYLVSKLDIRTDTFIEFGVETYEEATTRFLLLNNNWSGLVIDGSADNIRRIRQTPLYQDHQFTALHAFVTAENINGLIQSAGITGEIGLLHVDIDGNDYWVWKAISVVNPVIVIVEYNAVFGSERSITVPYQPDFFRTRAHHSNLYFGASLPALCQLAGEKGYAFIGCTSHGNNAYFVRNDRAAGLPALSAREGYVASKFRESRDEKGNLTYLSGTERLAPIRNLPVYNTHTQAIEML